jgi:hypothetical protein
MKSFNLSRWALEHKSFVVYLMLLVALAGILEYGRLGRTRKFGVRVCCARKLLEMLRARHTIRTPPGLQSCVALLRNSSLTAKNVRRTFFARTKWSGIG